MVSVTESLERGASALWKFFVLSTGLLAGISVSGQSPSSNALQLSEVALKVTDSGGAVIVNAEVVLQCELEANRTHTNEKGIINIKLHAGTCTVTASAPGFVSRRVTDFRVQPPNPSSLDIVLSVDETPSDSAGFFPSTPDIPVDTTELPNAFVSKVPNPETPMKFCGLMQDPEKYNGKLVKVRATWIYGFEWSYLHCLDCDGRVWMDTSDVDEESEKTLKHAPGAGIVNVDVEGIFHSGGSFGHLNGYKYQLTAHAVSNLVLISKGMKTPEKEREIERKFACGGAKPR